MKEEQPGPGHGYLYSPLHLQTCGVCAGGQGGGEAQVQRVWIYVPGPDQQQDEYHRGKQEPEETQNIEAQGEETTELRVDKRIAFERVRIPLSHLVDS